MTMHLTRRPLAGSLPILFVLALPIAVTAQTPPQFDVASIRPSADQGQQANFGLRITASQIRISYLSLKDYVAMAYDLPAGRVAGPDWLSQVRFDIAANLPDGATSADVPAMLQKLLADRFELKVHRESKEFPVYALTVGKDGPKLQAPAAAPDDGLPAGAVSVSGGGSANGVAVDLGGGASFSLGNNRLQMKRTTMTTLADTLTRLMDRPVIDATALPGSYDMLVELTPEDYSALMIRSAVNAGVVLPPQALRMLDTASADPFSGPLQQFGLTLTSRRAPLEVIVVDSVRRMPTDN